MGSVSGLSRLLSFEEEGQQQLHLEVSPRLQVAPTPPTDTASATPPAGAPPAAAPLAAPASEEQRRVQVAQLEQYLSGIGAPSADGDICNTQEGQHLVQFPAGGTFRSLVHTLLQDKLAENATLRGWVADASSHGLQAGPAPDARTLGDTGTPASSAPARASDDAKLKAAMDRLRVLDEALAVANRRAAAVAAAGKELERQVEAGEQEGESTAPGASSECAGVLATAMSRERRRMQQERRLRDALGDGMAPAEGLQHANATTEPGASQQQPSSQGSISTVGSTGPLLASQEALVEALLSKDAVANPYEHASAELARLDAQLALLLQQGEQDLCAAPAVMEPGPKPSSLELHTASSAEEGREDELAASREDYLRAQSEARAIARQLQQIDSTLRALRTGASGGAAATVAVQC